MLNKYMTLKMMRDVLSMTNRDELVEKLHSCESENELRKVCEANELVITGVKNTWDNPFSPPPHPDNITLKPVPEYEVQKWCRLGVCFTETIIIR